MTRAVLVVVAAALIGLVTLSGPMPAAPASKLDPRPKWEYKVISVSQVQEEKAWEKELNELGGEGWEVVATTNIGTTVRVVLKRPK